MMSGCKRVCLAGNLVTLVGGGGDRYLTGCRHGVERRRGLAEEGFLFSRIAIGVLFLTDQFKYRALAPWFRSTKRM